MLINKSEVQRFLKEHKRTIGKSGYEELDKRLRDILIKIIKITQISYKKRINSLIIQQSINFFKDNSDF